MTIFAAIQDQGIRHNDSNGNFYARLVAVFKNTRLFKSHVCRWQSLQMVSLVGIERRIAFIIYFNFLHTMTKEVKNRSVAKNSTNTLTSAHETCIQVIHQLIIPEIPVGLIGEKVTYSPKFLNWHKKRNYEISIPLPACGYFTILGAILYPDGSCMVKLSGHENLCHFQDGTHIELRHLVKYEPQLTAKK
jgi:hypothetical protein